MGGNIRQPGVNIANAVRIGGGFGLQQQGRALGVRRQHRIQQAGLAARRFLRHNANARAGIDVQAAARRGHFPGDQAQQGGFARAIAANKAHPPAIRDGKRRALEQGTASNAVVQVIDMQHEAGLVAQSEGGKKGERGRETN